MTRGYYFFWSIAAVIVIGIIVAFVIKSRSPSPSEVPQGSEQLQKQGVQTDAAPPSGRAQESSRTVRSGVAEVNYTAGGFVPRTVNMKAGETIRFVNRSRIGMRVSSNPHPTHTEYADLNQPRSSSVGEVYSLVLLKKGIFGYHNHDKPSDTGVLTIE